MIKKLSRRTILKTAATFLTPLVVSARDVSRIIVPFEPGGSSDLIGRAVASRLRVGRDSQWIVENAPGALGKIGAIRVARSTPDGRTLLLTGAGSFRALSGDKSETGGFHPLRELRALTILGEMPVLCIANKQLSQKDLRGYIAYLKKTTAPLMFGAAGVGTHVAGAMLAKHHEMQSVVVPYKGSVGVLQAVLSNEVPVGMIDPMLVAHHYAAGELQCFGTSTQMPVGVFKGVKTFAEQGVDGIPGIWVGFFVPVDTPIKASSELERTFKSISFEPVIQEVLMRGYLSGNPLYGAQAQGFVEQDIRSFQKQLKRLNITF